MGKRVRNRKNKEDRANNIGWADGVRADLLVTYVAGYKDAAAKGWVAQSDYVKVVTNHFFMCFDWRLQDHEEPTLPLLPYDPNYVDTDNDLTEEDIKLKREKYDKTREVRYRLYA